MREIRCGKIATSVAILARKAEMHQPTLNHRRAPLAFGALVSVLAVTMAACGSSGPSLNINYGGTTILHMTGQLTAKFPRAGDCIVGTSGTKTIAVTFKEVDAHLSGSTSAVPFSMIVNSPMTGGSFAFPVATSVSSVFLENTGGTVSYQWAAGTAFLFKDSTGTVTVSNEGTSGSINLTLQPTSVQPNKATAAVHVDGTWAGCPAKSG